MNDRELIELAAKAAGEDVEWHEIGSYFYRRSCNWPAEKGFFNPLHDDGEALRLAIALDIHVKRFAGATTAIVLLDTRGYTEHDHWALNAKDPMKSTRRAIVNVAANIGRSMP